MSQQGFSAISVFKFAQNWLAFFTILAGSLYAAFVVITSFFPDEGNLIMLSNQLKEVSIHMIAVLKPFIELVIVVWLTEFILKKLNINFSKDLSSIRLKLKEIIALLTLFIVLIALIILTDFTVYLKNIILFGLGIYIGLNSTNIKTFFDLSKKSESNNMSREN